MIKNYLNPVSKNEHDPVRDKFFEVRRTKILAASALFPSQFTRHY